MSDCRYMSDSRSRGSKLLFNKQITKLLMRLHECACWFASLLFAKPKDKFSRVEAHFIRTIKWNVGPMMLKNY